MHAKSLQSCPTLCDPMDCSPPGSFVHGFSRQEYWSGLPCPSVVDHILSELFTATHPSWVALQGMAHSFTELCKPLCHEKAVIHDRVFTVVPLQNLTPTQCSKHSMNHSCFPTFTLCARDAELFDVLCKCSFFSM